MWVPAIMSVALSLLSTQCSGSDARRRRLKECECQREQERECKKVCFYHGKIACSFQISRLFFQCALRQTGTEKNENSAESDMEWNRWKEMMPRVRFGMAFPLSSRFASRPPPWVFLTFTSF